MFNMFCRAVVTFALMGSLLLAAGCGVITGDFQRYQERAAQNEAVALAQKKYLENLPTCAIVTPIHESDFLFPYRSIVVHVKSYFTEHDFSKEGHGPGGNPQMDTYFKNTAEQLLSDKGYKVTLGRDLGQDEFLATTENCSTNSNRSTRSLREEVSHNHPLFMKLIEENSYPENYDAVMFLNYSYGDSAGISFQLFDTATKMIVMSTASGISLEKNKKYGTSYMSQIGGKTYKETPYWFEGSDEALLKRTINYALEYMPSWSKGKLVSPTSKVLLYNSLIWQNQGHKSKMVP